MNRLTRPLLPLVALLAMLPACAVNNAGVPLPGNGDGGATLDQPPVFVRSPDGALVLPDARYLADGAVVLADGALITTGTVRYADGAVVALDGALVPGDAPRPQGDVPTTSLDGGVTKTGDGGVTTVGDAPEADVDPMTGCGAREVCNNGRDDNCNGRVDEDCPCIPGMTVLCYAGSPIQAGVGACALGTSRCEGTGEFGVWSACAGAGMPSTEVCGNDVDDDCDGMTDEGCACRPGMTRMCYTGPDGTAGRGLCRMGTETCAADGSGWGPCTGQVLPTSDTCDGMDRDCDGNNYTGCGCMLGMTRSCYSGPTGTAGRGLCRAGTQTCVASTTGMGSMWGACSGEVLPGRDTCDGMDRDCDGTVNTGCVCTIGASRACYTGPTGTQGVGICRPGTQTCTASGTGSIWALCTGDTLPRTEVCANRLDDNCNGMVDEGCTTTPTCTPGMTLCGTRCVDTSTSTTDCGACGHACAATEACVMGVCVGNGMLRFTMTWDRMGDMDLHIVPPCGTEIYYGRLSACGGTLDHDSCPANRAGYTGDSCIGPENTFWASAPASGTYIVCANPYLTTTAVNFTIQVYRGATLVRTFTGTRAASPSQAYRACTRGGPTYVGDFVL